VVEPSGRDAAEVDAPAAIPPDYMLAPGDEVVLTIWGSVEADLRLVVDRSGLINVPRVGSIMVAGSRYADVGALIQRQMAKTFRNFELSVTLGKLRGVRVFVTGFAVKPGAYSVSSLSTVSSVLFSKAGGPSPSGSFRNIELRRNGKVVTRLDLYDLLALGKQQGDELVRAGDVIHVGPVGPQVALVGSVNNQAVYEIRPGETVSDLLRIAGGLNSVAEPSRLAMERLDDRYDKRVRELSLPPDAAIALASGDIVRAFSAASSALPQERQYKRVQIEGEVARPGEYVLPPNSTLPDLVSAAGGLTSKAFLFGTEFSRESVRQVQQQNYERMLRDLEIEVSRRANAIAGKPVESTGTQDLSNELVLQRMRGVKPTGRVVLQLPLDAQALPQLALEDGDRLNIPASPSSVGVFGSVPNAGNYLYMNNRTVDDYLRLAGSPKRGADTEGVFVLRANGNVESAQQYSGWMSFGTNKFAGLPVLPGDNIVVPEEVNKISTMQNLKDWAQIIYQFGLGVIAAKALN
jgi:protein involved in polysaccharide export with SLBB domain